MRWTCPNCDATNDADTIWCPDCGTERVCEYDGASIVETERELQSGGTQTVLECEECYGTKHRFTGESS